MIKTPCPLLSERPDVVAALDGELAYINSLPSRSCEDGSPRTNDRDHGIAGQLVTLSAYLRKAEDAWATQGGEEVALGVIRKLAGTCLRALILYGCPTRA